MAKEFLNSANCTAVVKKALDSLGITREQIQGKSPEEIAKLWLDTYQAKHGKSPDETGAKLF